jgi:hypothetical protein
MLIMGDEEGLSDHQRSLETILEIRVYRLYRVQSKEDNIRIITRSMEASQILGCPPKRP